MTEEKRHSRTSLVHLALVVLLAIVVVADLVVVFVVDAVVWVVVLGTVRFTLRPFPSTIVTTFGYFFLQKL